MTALVDAETYGRIVGDASTDETVIDQAIADAQRMVDEHCRRTFAYGTYTETLDRFANGVVYPKATPIEAVTDPAASTLRFGGIHIGGGWQGLSALSGLPPQTTVTYTGGYHPYGSGETPELPVKLVRVICRIAYLTLHPASLIASGVPAGAKSASVGDVSVSGDLAGLIAMDPSIERDLRRFVRHRPATLTGGF